MTLSEDERAGKIIFISSCILNQNNRFPGIALYNGPISELIDPIIKNGIGIEQLPCLECMGWGGVSRKSIFKFLPIIFKHEKSKLIRFLSKLWLWKFKRLCKRKAKIVVNQIEDYINSNYQVLGIIAMNDSPTCGISKTIDLFDLIFNYEKFNIKTEDLINPKLEQMKTLMPKIIIDGQGLFMRKLDSRLKKRKLNIEILGFNPWNNISVEVESILSKLLT